MTGRNDDCPCGSGRKYKKCCLAKEQEASRSEEPPSHVEQRDIPQIIHLLETRMADEFRLAMTRMVTPDSVVYLPALSEEDPELFGTVHVAIVEAAVAHMARSGAAFRLGNRLTAVQARYMDQLASNTMRIWRVVEVRPGEGMTVEEVGTGHREIVVEASGSRSVVPWQLVAARVIHDMPFPTFANLFLLADKDLDRYGSGRPSVVDPDVRDPAVLLELELVRDFVRRSVSPRSEMPQLVDEGSQAPMEFVHDRFTLLDERGFRAALEKRDEVELDPEDEAHWIRFQDLGNEVSRALCHLELTGNVLQMVSRSRKAATENRAWLKGVCGDTMKFRSRRIDDPRDMVGKVPKEPKRAPVQAPMEFWERMYRQQYSDWAGSPLPLFEGRSPREMARTVDGRRKVLDLVRSYQAQEHRMARDQEREPVDLSWLLQEAGLEDARLG